MKTIQLHKGGHRRVTWLELFYDLVYVATMIQLGNMLSDDVSVEGFLKFAVLFVPIWWAWTGITFYYNRYVVDDVSHRLLIFGQIFAIAVLAVSISGVFGELYTQFTLSYVVIRLILVVLYIRAAQHVPETAPLAYGYAAGFTVGAIIWFISIFLPEPINYIFWAIGLAVELAVPLTPHMVKWQATFPPDNPHMIERYGIFTIIVLGESFVKTIDNLAGIALTTDLMMTSTFGLAITCSLWWLYFDDVSDSRLKPVLYAAYVWIYSHLFVALGLTAFGVAAKKVLLYPQTDPLADKYRWLIAMTIMIYLIFVALIDEVTQRADDALDNQSRALWRIGSALVLLGIGVFGGSLTPMAVMLVIALVCVTQIMVDFWQKSGAKAPIPA